MRAGAVQAAVLQKLLQFYVAAERMAESEIVIHDKATGRWLRFSNPLHVITTFMLNEIVPALERIERMVNEQGLHAAGFISYEAAAAFDPALRTHKAGEFPLLWFGIYPLPDVFEPPAPNYAAFSLQRLTSSVNQYQYEKAIVQIKQHIYAGNTYQVNYTIRLRSGFSGDPWNLFLALVRAQDPGYSAWVDTGRYAVCSASPELFFRLDHERLVCKPMKGTVKRGRTLEEDEVLSRWLQGSEKNRAENLMIVDMIRNDLGRVAEINSVIVPRLFEVERRPTLWQMTSTVEAVTDKPLVEIFKALFPCASITGAPKVRTTEIIHEIEPDPRGIYTGCIGYIAPARRSQFNVAIRTAVVNRAEGTLEYGAGGGIVWDSAGDDEYREALLKARVLTERRPEFSLLETILWTPEEGWFLLQPHLRRLADSARYFDYRVDIGKVESALLRYIVEFKASQRVRLLVSNEGAVELESSPISTPEPGKPVRVKLARRPVHSAEVFLYHKTTYRSMYDEALRGCPDCDDVLLWNERGELTESSIANIVVEIDGALLTPPVSSGLLGGTFRAMLLQQGKVEERVIRIEDLKKCTRIYLINSVRKWRAAALE
jgi:para-aminobenzoate synthetase / 4-amino-4-deoxychorismate lyase